MKNMKYNLVIGGGITGITAAYELSKKKKNILLIEKSNQLGGVLRSVKPKRTWVEEYYHVLFTGRDELAAIYELARELGLSDRIIWKGGVTGFYYKNKLYKLSSLFDLIMYKPLSLWDKITLLKLLLKIKMIKNPLKHDYISAKDWVIRNSNKTIYEKFFEPLLRSKFGKDADSTSAAWLIIRMIVRNKGRIGAEKIGYMEGGFQQLIEKMVEKITERGQIILNTTAKKFTIKNNRVESALLSNGKKVDVESVISTIPPHELTKIVALPRKYLICIDVPYVGVVCPMLCLKKPLTKNIWWTNITADICFGAVVEHSRIQNHELYGGHIVYLPSYPNQKSEVWKMSDKEIFEKYFRDLQKIFPHIKKADVVWWKIGKDKAAGINFKKGAYTKIAGAGCRTPIKNLFVGGMFNTKNEARMNASIAKGKELACLV